MLVEYLGRTTTLVIHTFPRGRAKGKVLGSLLAVFNSIINPTNITQKIIKHHIDKRLLLTISIVLVKYLVL